MSGNFKYTGLEFANYTLGQGGFNAIDDDKTHVTAPEIPRANITRLSKNSSNTRVYCDNNPTLFALNDVISINDSGPLFDSRIHGDHTISASSATYFDTNHPWPPELSLLTDWYPADENFPAASATYKSGAGMVVYPDIEQWTVVQIIAKKAIGSGVNIILWDSTGAKLDIDGTSNGILNLTGVACPGSWVKIEANENKIIAYRG